jgi:hypothetical protein
MKNNIIESSIDLSIRRLIQESKSLFSMFDEMSSSIAKLEKELSEAKAFFAFRYKTSIISESHTKKAEERHSISSHDVLGYRTYTVWYLSWEKGDNDTPFRLFLIGEEKEIIYYSIPTDVEGCGEEVFETKTIFKKPLMETSLAMRIQYSEFILPFIDAFTDYLRECRQAFEESEDIPF